MQSMNNRVGHVSAKYQDTLIVVWGGFSKKENNRNEFCDPSKVILYHTLHNTAKEVKTSGDIPNENSGATAAVLQDDMYVIFGASLIKGVGLVNINDVYVLNIPTLRWSKVTQRVHANSGPNMPLKADKHVSWIYRNQIFIFGGYGPLTGGFNQPKVTQTMETGVPIEMGKRGWNNQLVIYDIGQDAFMWPKIAGDIPCPRAAAAAFCDEATGKAYIFGGRSGVDRLNDIYCVDLQTKGYAVWSVIQYHDALDDGLTRPQGRSWHSFSHLGGGNALLYGGFSKDKQLMNDAWLWKSDCQEWSPMARLRRDKRMWHTAIYMGCLSVVCLIGGAKQSIASEASHAEWHPLKMDQLMTSPPSLPVAALEAAVAHYAKLMDQVSSLPQTLSRHIQSRYDALHA